MSKTYKYKEDEKVKNAFDAYNNYKGTQKPKDYSYSDSKLLDKTKNDYMNSKDFSYNLNNDPLYQQYKQSYIREGKKAMEDTVGDAASLTGGYANSYAVTAGNAAYNTYIDKLNDVIPELYSLAYSKYKDNVDQLGDKLKYLSDRDDAEYSRYLDNYKSYTDEVDRLSGVYLDMSKKDRDTQESEWESAYKFAALDQDKYRFDEENKIKNQAQSLEQEKYYDSKREYFREDEIYVMLGNGGYYNALLALDYNYDSNEMIKMKALSMGIPEDYVDSYIEAKRED